MDLMSLLMIVIGRSEMDMSNLIGLRYGAHIGTCSSRKLGDTNNFG